MNTEKFWSNVDKNGPVPSHGDLNDRCWIWTARMRPDGYGALKVDGRESRSHRVAYGLLVGDIPKGLVLDHLCRNRACCNPSHLEPVTIGENVLRGNTFARHNALKTHCKNGHELSGDNVYRAPSRPERRMCRACYIEKGIEWKKRNPDRVAKQNEMNRLRKKAQRAALSIADRKRLDRDRYARYRERRLEQARVRLEKNRDHVNRLWREAKKRRDAKTLGQ